MTEQHSTEWGDAGILALFRSPFLIPSVLFHSLMLLLALRAASLTLVQPPVETPIAVQLLEVREGASSNKSIGPKVGSGGPRTMPKLGAPVAAAPRSGSIDRGSTETLVPAEKPVEAAPPPRPAPLPGPKVLAADPRFDALNVKETSPDSLVRLPVKETPTQLPGSAAADFEANQRSLAALKNSVEPAGIKALKEGTQVPGALKGAGAGFGPSGVPGGSRSGTGLAGAGTGVGSGGGTTTGLKGLASADYGRYLDQLKKRVESVWRYPEGVSGVQKVAILFTLDRSGRLVQSEVLESSDAKLNASAVDAMRRAAPFAPIPESLKDLANTPLRMQFTISIGVRG